MSSIFLVLGFILLSGPSYGDSTPSISELSESNFKKEVLDHKGLALVEFWASWCGVCKTFEPTLTQFAETQEKNDPIKVGKVNIDEDPKLTAQYHIRAIPTLLLFRNGKIIDQKAETLSLSQLKDWVKKHKVF